jgi:hypothetical protein
MIGVGLAFTSFADSTNQTSSDVFLMRTYKVSTETFLAHLKHRLPPKSGETDTALLIRYFKQKHIEIKPPESVFWNETMSLIFAKATKPDQDKIEQLVIEIVDH